MDKAKAIAVWVVTILLAFLFVLSSYPKLQSAPAMVERFQSWGYPNAFLLLIGVLELAGAFLVAIPKTTFYGGVLLVTVMLGAVYTHLSSGVGTPFFAAFVGILAATVAWSRRPGYLRSS